MRDLGQTPRMTSTPSQEGCQHGLRLDEIGNDAEIVDQRGQALVLQHGPRVRHLVDERGDVTFELGYLEKIDLRIGP
jgi:hypothetical protein